VAAHDDVRNFAHDDVRNLTNDFRDEAKKLRPAAGQKNCRKKAQAERPASVRP
jgi:hypothetical protein